MVDKKLFARSFGRENLSCAAFIGSFIIAVNLATVLKQYLYLPSIYSHGEGMNPIILNFSNFRSHVYDIKGDIRIHGISSIIYIASSHKHNHNLTSLNIRLYGQRPKNISQNITSFEIKMDTADRIPRCNRNLSDIPAIVFSGRACISNHFHDFADVLFPLFSTSFHFKGRVIFLVTNRYPPWMSKYRAILKKLSENEVYDIDKETEVLCFSKMMVGLRGPNSLFIHPSETAKFSMTSFTNFLRTAYSLERHSLHHHRLTTGRDFSNEVSQPRMLIISRRNDRRLINEHEIGDMARRLGFDVILENLTSNQSLVSKLVNSVDVLVGVHGAGLTNMVFLPENAIVVQIVPYGADTDARVCFEWAARCMELRYLEYKVIINESSLFGKYPLDSDFLRFPDAIRNGNYGLYHDVYFSHQDLNLDLGRFWKTLVRAFDLVGT